MSAPAQTVAEPWAWTRAAALACGGLGVLLALFAPTLSAWVERRPLRSFTIFDGDHADTPAFAALFWTYTAFGAAAVVLALTAYLHGGFARTGRVGLALGIIALAWKYVIYAFVIAVVLTLFASGIGS